MQKVAATSGKYLNIGNAGFRSIRNGEYIDKSGLVGFMNRCLNTPCQQTETVWKVVCNQDALCILQ